MRYLIIVCLMFGIGTAVHAQNSVSGRIVDKNSLSPLEYATVSVIAAADSTFVTATAAGKDALFRIENLSAGDYLLEIKFGGYVTATVKVKISGSGESRDMGDIALEKRPGDKPGKPDKRKP